MSAAVVTDEQRELALTVRSLLAKHADHSAVRRAIDSELGYDEKLWQLLCQQIGVAALAIPEEYGGIGAGPIESHLVLEELGRTLAPTPMLGSVVLGAQTLLALGDNEACSRLLPGIAEGTSIAALCWAGEGGWDTPGVSAGSDGKLNGTAHYVLDGHIADVLIVVALAGDGVAIFDVDPTSAGVSCQQVRAMDPTRRLSVIDFVGVEARPFSTGNATAVLDRVRDIACAALAAEEIGAAAHSLAMTVEYTKSRVQFGRPIGSFQALRHRMADMYVLVETARSMSYAATASLDTADCASAKVYCSETFSHVAAESIQLHGGIAITWEHDAHLYFKRAHGSSQLFGQPAEYVTRLRAAPSA